MPALSVAAKASHGIKPSNKQKQPSSAKSAAKGKRKSQENKGKEQEITAKNAGSEGPPPPSETGGSLSQGKKAGGNKKNRQKRGITVRYKPESGIRLFNVGSEEFRKLMSQVPQPVVVISSLELPPFPAQVKPLNRPNRGKNATKENPPLPEPVPTETDPIPRAMTVSSFASLSLTPRKSVTFNVNLPSHTFKAMESTRRFNVHVLMDNEDGSRLARRFAQAGYSRLDEKPPLEDESPEAAFARDLDLQVSNTSTWLAEWAKRAQECQAFGRNAVARQWAPLSRNAMPILMNPGILYTLRCIVRRPPWGVTAPLGKSGFIQVDETNAIVVGDVLDCIIHAKSDFQWPILDNDVALSYVQKGYVMSGGPHKQST